MQDNMRNMEDVVAALDGSAVSGHTRTSMGLSVEKMRHWRRACS